MFIVKVKEEETTEGPTDWTTWNVESSIKTFSSIEFAIRVTCVEMFILIFVYEMFL